MKSWPNNLTHKEQKLSIRNTIFDWCFSIYDIINNTNDDISSDNINNSELHKLCDKITDEIIINVQNGVK